MARAKKEAALTPEERLQAALVPDWEWPYKLPKNWCWTTVGTICDGFQYGYTEKAILMLSVWSSVLQIERDRRKTKW